MRFEFGEYVVEVDRHELRRGGEPATVEPQVFDVLVYLLQNRDRVVSHDDLIAGVWDGRAVSRAAVTACINAARRAVGDSGAMQDVIRTLPRKGVRFVAEAREYPTSSSPRGTAAISDADDHAFATMLFTDIVGSTGRVAQLGDRQWRALLLRHDEVVREQIDRFRGTVVKTTGDGFLATFDSPVRAVRCAAAVCGAVVPLGIAVRSGVHAGEIAPTQSDISGIAVHVAARIAATAQAGETVVSRTVRDLVSGSDLVFDERGPHALRGVPEEVHLYVLRSPGALVQPTSPATTRATDGQASTSDPLFLKPSILVLPFRNISGDAREDYFTDAVTSDLTVDLSRMRDVAVISAATALTYKGSPLDIRQIGRELGVRYLLVGNIGRTGDLVRTNVQLIDAASGEQLWGDRFENSFAELGSLENEITGRIAASLNVQLVRAEGRRAEKTQQPDALDLRLRATSLFFGSVAPENTLATRQLLLRSVELDPDCAETWARLAEITASDYINHWNNTGIEELRAADEAAHKALLIDPNNALAYAACGLVERARGAHHTALEAFSRAIDLDRNFAFAYAHKGAELMLTGRPAEAPPLVEQAIRLSPHDPHIGIFYWIIGRAYFFAGNYEEAIPWLRRSVGARSNLWFNRLYLVSACALAGMPYEASRALEEYRRRFPAPVCTLAVVERLESTVPNDHPSVVAARTKFHDGLLQAGMAEG